jgi:phosphatidylglycerophosphatase A
MREPVHLIAFGFGAGLSPWAPGTFGTLVAIPIVLFVMQFGLAAHLGFAIFASLFGIYVCGESARRLDVHDHPGIVWDEIAGFAITMLTVPANSAGGGSQLIYWTVAGFTLFRLLDIWKPWPIREADHSLRGGLGIMLDDILAGIFAAAILLGLRMIL